MNYFQLRHYNEDLGNTQVENIFINHYMPGAPGDYVKVYLLGLKCSCSPDNNCLSNDIIAKTIGTSVEEVEKAWVYWVGQGILRIIPSFEKDLNSIEYLSIRELMLNIKGEDKESPAKRSADRLLLARQDSEIKEMFDYINKTYGRVLSQNETYTILDWIEDYKFTAKVVIMIIDYCQSRNIKDLPYLKQVARNWFDAGVNTEEKALEYSNRHKERWQKYNKVLSFLRIKRQPTIAEEKVLYKWFYEYSFDDEIIMKACELTINTIKPSISYMDKILTDWYEKGFKTVDEIMVYQSRTNKTQKTGNAKPQKSFDNFAGRKYDADDLKQKLLRRSRGGFDD